MRAKFRQESATSGEVARYYITLPTGEMWLHREDGPAFINHRTGYQEYVLWNKRHRLDGPAVSGGLLPWHKRDRFFIEGVEYDEFEFWLKSGAELRRSDPNCI